MHVCVVGGCKYFLEGMYKEIEVRGESMYGALVMAIPTFFSFLYNDMTCRDLIALHLFLLSKVNLSDEYSVICRIVKCFVTLIPNSILSLPRVSLQPARLNKKYHSFIRSFAFFWPQPPLHEQCLPQEQLSSTPSNNGTLW